MLDSDTKVDCVILGNHPCSYFAAALLRVEPALSVLHLAPPCPPENRLVMLNPAFFSLHPVLEGIAKQLSMTAIHGLKFLADDSATACEHRQSAAMAHVCNVAELTAALANLAHRQGSRRIENASLQIDHLDEMGLGIRIGNRDLHPAALILASMPDDHCQARLGINDPWDQELLFRFTSANLPASPAQEDQPLLRMSLDVDGSLAWGWLLVHENRAQAIVAQPINSIGKYDPHKLLLTWIDVLKKHGELPSSCSVAGLQIESRDLPLAGALSQEGVANRTLLIGPAGGFYSACGEDIYPNCWSALFATEVLRSALKEKHLQDAINTYRMNWRTTLGDYLRGPQQNLRFLLPLIYRNQIMTTRLTESILLGRSVVR